ncbi:hypothetical protein ACFSJS_09580 [Streptomyces desertarenae]|uniref:Calcineurin-like phosphoesterase domain-containing protein n=1 Tax=Streptomyces desertarenae TaxID=2666184 RepID=A0ABW4PJ12_9ACTN
MGAAHSLPDARPWKDIAELPISAAAVGNHEFDGGVSTLRTRAKSLPFPLLCANVDVGLPGCAVVDTVVGPVGVIGLTHPHSQRLSQAPQPVDDWSERVNELARSLRRQGVRWTVALLHDGAAWWPQRSGTGAPVGTRSDRLAQITCPWGSRSTSSSAGTP